MSTGESLLDRDTSGVQRVLVVDDNPSIHDDFRKILCQDRGQDAAFDALDAALFDDASKPATVHLGVDSAYQGQEAVERVDAARARGAPYALAFVDIRMPPGWDGIETTARLLAADPDLQIVICTAYSDFSWAEIIDSIGETDRVLILKKPFSVIEVRQLATSLLAKWRLARENQVYVNTLEERVGERTRDLERANARLRDEVEQRERIESELRKAQRLEALGRMAAGIGHEINNPLNFISGGVELIQAEFKQLDTRLPEHAMRSLNEALDAALVGVDRIAHIVRNIKLFSRTRDTVETVDIAETLALCHKMMVGTLPAGIELVMDLVAVPPVLGNRVELEQVFINIMENAAHALTESKAAGGAIHVKLWLDDDRFVTTEVSDTGPGIGEDVIEKIFDPFFTTKSPDKGTGLGLSICHAIVTGLGGAIELHSNDRSGTTVIIRLPATQDAPAPAAALASDDGDEAPDVHKARILVIDDEPIILSILGHALEQYDVVTCGNAHDALARYLAEPFDLILCDVMMPGMNGLEFYEEIAKQSPGAEDRIIFVTGGARFENVREFLDRVNNQCIEKPFQIESLHAQVRKALRKQSE